MEIPDTPKFLFAPDHSAQQLYIYHTQEPKCLIWLRQTVPAQMFIIDPEDIPEEQTGAYAKVLQEAAEFYKGYVGGLDNN